MGQFPTGPPAWVVGEPLLFPATVPCPRAMHTSAHSPAGSSTCSARLGLPGSSLGGPGRGWKDTRLIRLGRRKRGPPKCPLGGVSSGSPKGSLQDAWRPFSVGAGGLVCACSCSGRTRARCPALLLPQRCVALRPRRAPGCAALPAGQPVAHGQASALRCPHRTQLRTCMKGG